MDHLRTEAGQDARADAPERHLALLEAVTAGSEEALATLHAHYGPGLLRWLGARLRDAQLAEEILADVFVAVWRGASSFRGDATVRAWIYGIAKRRVRDAQRRAGLLTVPSSALLERADQGPGPGEVFLGLPSAHGLVDRIATLPEALREVVVLCFDQQMTYAEIAHVVGVPVGTVKSRLNAARSRLRVGEP